jgi:hypothetical protein
MTTLKPGALKLGEHFVIPGGDGDQKFFLEPRFLRLTEASWFPGQVRRGEALLFVIDEGDHAGQFVALTTKTMARLQDQISEYGWASVVVHLIRNPTASFDGNEKDAAPIGMAFVERV